MKSKNNISRRDFMQKTAKGLAGAAALGLVSSCNNVSQASKAPTLPKRTLGRTGLEISILSFGAGNQWIRDDTWPASLERAIEMGINYFDTAPGYGKKYTPCSEARLGTFLPKYRDKIILSTKFDSREPDEAMKTFERSLKRLKTDYVDILLLHGVGAGSPKAPPKDLSKDPIIFKTMRKLKEQGVARHIGFSTMYDGKIAKTMIERLDPDVVVMTLNATKYGSMAEFAIPAAKKRNAGIIAMKVMRWVVGRDATAKELLHYDLALDSVASALIGHGSMEVLEENYRNAMEFAAKGPVADAKELEARVAHLATPDVLQWARPDYDDEMVA